MKQLKPKKPEKQKPEAPRAQPGDHVFFQGGDGPMAGQVLCCGKHGATVVCEGGQQHKVRWDKVVGHKQRAQRQVTVVDQGEDGAICEDETGKRFYLRGHGHEPPVTDDSCQDDQDTDGQDADDDEDDGMRKSLVIFTSPTGREVLRKALANRPGLALRDVTDKRGHQTKRWMRTAPDQPAGRQAAAPKPQQQRGGGQQQAEQPDVVGKVVPFTAGSFKGRGEVVASGKDGVTVQDSAGREHQVRWEELHGGNGNGGEQGQQAQPESQAADQGDKQGKQQPANAPAQIPHDQFTAASFASEHDDPDVTADAIMAEFGDDVRKKMDEVRGRLGDVQETIEMHKGEDGEYTPERQELHAKIIDHFLSPEKIEAATPAEGEKPTFTILGGRGGSGKSWFNGNVYDEGKAIVLDADEIKGMLPEYAGWNAHQVHEESGELFDYITDLAQEMGLNIVHDATMKTTSKAVDLVRRFKDAGYRVDAHYMHLPRQEAAKRAVGRFMGPTGRYVPVEVVLSNTDNEKSFDAIKPLVDSWSFRDNNVEKGQPPRLISEFSERGEGTMSKSFSGAIILVRRVEDESEG